MHSQELGETSSNRAGKHCNYQTDRTICNNRCCKLNMNSPFPFTPLIARDRLARGRRFPLFSVKGSLMHVELSLYELL